jgi:hypothetical protein
VVGCVVCGAAAGSAEAERGIDWQDIPSVRYKAELTHKTIRLEKNFI